MEQLGSRCMQILRPVAYRKLVTGQPLVRTSTTSLHNMPQRRPNMNRDLSELEKEIKNDLSIYNREENQSSVIHARRRSVEFAAPRDIERIVDNHVLEAMQNGDFDNLPGMGKPFKEEYENPFVETGLAKINNILMSDGYKPSWILLAMEIRVGIHKARLTLAADRHRLGVSPLSPEADDKLKMHVKRFQISVLTLNEKIHQHNFEVPFLRCQMVPYSMDKETAKVLEKYMTILPTDYKDTVSSVPLRTNTSVNFLSIWKDIKNVFA